MRNPFAIALFGLALIALPALASTSDSSHTTSAKTHPRSAPAAVRAHPNQGGHYVGGKGSAHKGGTYINPRTGNHYSPHPAGQ